MYGGTGIRNGAFGREACIAWALDGHSVDLRAAEAELALFGAFCVWVLHSEKWVVKDVSSSYYD